MSGILDFFLTPKVKAKVTMKMEVRVLYENIMILSEDAHPCSFFASVLHSIISWFFLFDFVGKILVLFFSGALL